MAKCCSLFNARSFRRISHVRRTNELLEVQNENLGTLSGNFLHDTPGNWFIQVHSFVIAQKQPLSKIYISPDERVCSAFSREFSIENISESIS